MTRGETAAPSPRLAPGVECRPLHSGILLAAPEGRDYCQVDLTLEQLTEVLAGRSDGRAAGGVDEDADRLADAADLVAQLRADGYLTDSPPAPPVRPVVVTRDGIEVAGADRLVRLVYRALQPVWNRFGALCLAALAGLGLATPFLGVVPEASQAASPVLAAAAILALLLPITVVHELGHALVVARHGRRIGRVGVGLYWGGLTFYVDATAAFFLPRLTRLRQAAAGPVAEAATAGVLALTALAVPPGAGQTLLGQAAGLAALGVALNLVPLLKLDGYWLLADALDAPDLHEQCRAAIGRVARGSRSRPDLVRAAYAAVGLLFGVALLGYSLYLWVALIGQVIVAAWSESLLGKVLACALAFPLLGLLAQVAASLAAVLRSHRPAAAAHQP